MADHHETDFEKLKIPCVHPNFPDMQVFLTGKRTNGRSLMVTQGLTAFGTREIAIASDLYGHDPYFFLFVLLADFMERITDGYKNGLSFHFEPEFMVRGRKLTFTEIEIDGIKYMELAEEL